jgi:Flp pilus assembly protein TadD/tRNA A-37 threonylcarbamoyl transferase component Bud32
MDRTRWHEVEALFQAALEREPRTRSAFLEEMCASDPELRQEVESLLRAHADASGYLESPALGAQPSSEFDLRGRLTAALAGRYTIERELGGGGMSRVFVATETALGRRVVVKVLSPEVAAEMSAERFRREIHLAASLQHPHIVPVHAAGQAGDLLYYTMPFVEGESLRERLMRKGSLPVANVVRLLRDLADALSYAHRQGVVHRDIKPANVLLTGTHAVVTDFGIAKAMVAATTTSGAGSVTAHPAALTSTGLVLGTPAYMAPEQAAGDQTDHRADLYALGCLAYELLTGQPPFTGASAQALIAAHIADQPKPVTHRRQGIPVELNGLVMRLLEKRPADRPQTADEVLRDLETLSVSARHLSLLGTLGIYLASSLVVLGLAYLVMIQLGLPDWVVPSAGVLLLIGLPVILATALLQGRRVAAAHALAKTAGLRRRPWLTWRRTISGGVLAFAGLGIGVSAYMALRALGIGPVGSLLAAGVLKEREPVLLADFENRTGDSLLGDVVTDAFRVDLAQSTVVSLVPPERVAGAFERMRRPATTELDAMIARELALREGIKAVVTGEIASAGPQVAISAQLISPKTGEVLAARRETAPDSTEIMGAVDRLSKKLRERMGESLKALRNEPPLEQVTTNSLAALRKYSQAVRRRHEDEDRAIRLLEEAVALDTAFAMGHRMLGRILLNRGDAQARATDALVRAYRQRSQLTERERYLTEATYYEEVTDDPDRAETAYRALLESYPDDRTALNNLGVLYMARQQYSRAESLFRRLVAVDSFMLEPLRNLVFVQVLLGKPREAKRMLSRLSRRFPNNPWISHDASLVAYSGGDYRGAETHLLTLRNQHGLFWRAVASHMLAHLASLRGKVAETEGHLRDAVAAVDDSDPLHYVLLSISQAEIDIDIRGLPARGLKHVERAIARFPLQSMSPVDRPYLALAITYARAGRPQRARSLLTEYELATDSALRQGEASSWHIALGELALAEGRPDDAVPQFKRGAVSSREFHLALGRAYDQGRKPDSAIAAFERYVTTPYVDRIWTDATWLPGVLRRLGELYEARLQREKARHYYTRFLELWNDCDPELRPAVVGVRRRLQLLREEATGVS